MEESQLLISAYVPGPAFQSDGLLEALEVFLCSCPFWDNRNLGLVTMSLMPVEGGLCTRLLGGRQYVLLL